MDRFGVFDNPLAGHLAAMSGGVYKGDFHCYSMAMYQIENNQYESGGKIVLPASVLERLTRMNIEYPMLFKLTHCESQRYTHCGVIEFSAQEGRAYVPHWMMNMLQMNEGNSISLEYVSLVPCTYAKFQPITNEFLDLTNPKSLLERTLRSFACLTLGDVITIHYIGNEFQLRVLELKPKDEVTIIECDMEVDFAAPEGYVSPKREIPVKEEMETDGVDPEILATANSQQNFFAFKGSGQRLDGKTKGTDSPGLANQGLVKRGIPNYSYKANKITFPSAKKLAKIYTQNNDTNNTNDSEDSFSAFKGEGNVLKQQQRKK
ncbi:Ubiquitin fusion degradation protein 1-like [Oopsacas minuta]|uniref:Ubiquitin fusion degradation protein 1-like n=1 Tax=Oopsacas minuta TaxID=111878 RepID=A0AAV7KJK4_9METZ|nr:Ubiquitin fusion degradation protein 1-like [Oopsacas minuta]